MGTSNFAIQNLQFDERGLIPAIVQNSRTQQILQFLYLNVSALTRTLQTGIVHHCTKPTIVTPQFINGVVNGETTATIARNLEREPRENDNGSESDTDSSVALPLLQRVIDICFDPSGTALVILIDPENVPVRSTFSHHLYETDYEKAHNSLSLVHPSSLELGILLDELYRLIEDRKQKRPEGSYTTFLFNAGVDKILKQIGLETAEMIIAAKNGVTPQITIEIADLIYHLLVLMSQSGVRLIDIFNELKQRATRTTEQKSSH
jgi:phosphoribosyl-AMP cyclohydrolase / phosphoribosyl-ATP pyrophosphohydrolase